MRKVILYIAMSLDGFIADEFGGVDWLVGQEDTSEEQGSYARFIKTVDTVIMGYTTYHQVTTELAPGNWPYKGLRTYVLTHKYKKTEEDIIFTDKNIQELVTKIRMEPGKNIWICGGANLVNQFMKEDLIDRYHITVIPTILGKGIPLFHDNNSSIRLKLISSESYNGMIDLIYERRE
ncbi:dihydrofolate reductase family protein [Anaerosporobacter sp.]